MTENNQWHYDAGVQQGKNNQLAYPAKGWPTYPDGSYNTNFPEVPVDDWVPGSEPAWQPIAGGMSQDKGTGGRPAAPAAL